MALFGFPGDYDSIGRVESLNHWPARLTKNTRHLAVDPNFSVVVDHDFKSDGRTRSFEVSDFLRDSDINSVPVEADLGSGTPLVKSYGIDGFPLRIIEVRRACIWSVVVDLDRAAARIQVGANGARACVHVFHFEVAPLTLDPLHSVAFWKLEQR